MAMAHGRAGVVSFAVSLLRFTHPTHEHIARIFKMMGGAAQRTGVGRGRGGFSSFRGRPQAPGAGAAPLPCRTPVPPARVYWPNPRGPCHREDYVHLGRSNGLIQSIKKSTEP